MTEISSLLAKLDETTDAHVPFHRLLQQLAEIAPMDGDAVHFGFQPAENPLPFAVELILAEHNDASVKAKCSELLKNSENSVNLQAYDRALMPILWHIWFFIVDDGTDFQKTAEALQQLRANYALYNSQHGEHDKHASLSALSELLGETTASQSVSAFLETLAEHREMEQRPQSWVERVSGATSPPALPVEAPATWKHDKQPGDTPVTFIQRHYEPWLGKGLNRADINRLDPSLYTGLANWLRKNDLPDGFDLPTKKEVLDREFDASGTEFDQLRKHVERLKSAGRRRDIQK
jgi:hypothetical protein